MQEEDNRIKDIGKQLAPFTSSGQFGQYFDKPHNVEFSGDFNVLELDGLSETPRLQAVVLFMLIVQISHSMYHEYKNDRNIKRLVIVDEAWDLLSNSKAVEKFLETGFRRFRKYNGSGCIITQSVLDTQKTDAGKAISENGANTFILSQKTSAIAVAEKEDLMALPPAG
ncbi:type IV secretion system protein TraC, partial [Vibrio breoganii]